MEPDLDAYVMDFESYAAHFALSPEGQAEVARRLPEDTERNAAKQAGIEAKRGAEEIERVDDERRENEMKEATTTKLKEYRRAQQRERVEYQVLRIGPDYGQQRPTDGEIRDILRKDPRNWSWVWDTFCHPIHA